MERNFSTYRQGNGPRVAAAAIPAAGYGQQVYFMVTAMLLGLLGLSAIKASAQRQGQQLPGGIKVVPAPKSVSGIVPGRLLVSFNQGVVPQYTTISGKAQRSGISRLDELNQQNGCTGFQRLSVGTREINIYSFDFPASANVEQLIQVYKASGLFQSVEPDYLMGIAATANDPYYFLQWGQKNNGSFSSAAVAATAGADIDMELAWNLTTGSSSVTVAVIDAGLKMDHPEFAGRIWSNPAETVNGIDDDGNGLIDDTKGWDFINNDNNPADDHGHGIHVSSIIAASGNNSSMMTGINWSCKVMPIKSLGATGTGSGVAVISGIFYATSKGAHIINMSLGSLSSFSNIYQQAITHAWANGVTVIAAMGNDNVSTPFYPAAYNHVIAVGATRCNDSRALFSNYGSHISVCAPGDVILGLDETSNTDLVYMSGTSQATPQVAGVASLMLALDPSKTPDQIKAILEETAEDMVGNPSEDVAGFDNYHGHGRINAYQALLYCTTPSAITGTTSICVGATSALGSATSGGTWSSSNTAVATVGTSGLLTGVAEGTAIITYKKLLCATTVNVTIKAKPTAVSISPASASVCLGTGASFTASGSTANNVVLLSQDWNSGLFNGWTVTSNNLAYTQWQIKGSGTGAVPGITGDGTNFIESVPYYSPANTTTILTSPVFSTVGYTAATLTYNQYHTSSASDVAVAVEYSVNGGTTWTTLYSQLGVSQGLATWSAGTPQRTITLPAPALGVATVRLRWNYNSTGGQFWTLDNIAVKGNSSITYSWLAAGGATGLSCSSCTTATITPSALGANVYSATATSANGCTNGTGVTVTATSLGSITGTATTCVGGSTTLANGTAGGAWSTSNASVATVNASGVVSGAGAGTANITYTVSGCIATRTVTVGSLSTSVTGVVNVACNGASTGSATVSGSGGTTPYTYAWSPGGGSSATKTGMSAGTTYSCVVSDAAGCSGTQTVTVTEPAAIVTSISASANVACNGGSTGSATVGVTGGATPYSYFWTGGGTLATKTGLSAGTVYTCTVTDANSCAKTQTVTVTQPAALTSSVSGTTNVSCNGGANGTATVAAGGGTTPYSYAWSGGGSAATKTGMSAGTTYTCTITDGNSCAKTQTVTVTHPAALALASTSVVNPACYGAATGSITVAASGGTSPYTYAWSGGGTGATKTGLAAGTHTATATDANSCVKTFTVTLTQPASAVTASVSATSSVACFGGATGSATVTVTGGTPSYFYSWSPGGGSSNVKTGMSAATIYSCAITDASGCAVTQTVTVTQPAAALAASVSATTNVSCNGGTNGTATVGASGGTSPYSYSWSGGGSSATKTGMSAGTVYTCTVTDANLCTKTQTVTVTQPAALTASVSATSNVSCAGGANGSATIAAGGGTPAYSYLWAPGGGTAATRSTLSAGITYTCTVTDINSCVTTRTVTVTQPSAISLTFTPVTNVACNGGATGSATASVTGGTSPYTYSWTGGGSAATRTGLSAGTYTCTVTDANFCAMTGTVTITQPSAFSAAIIAQTNVNCNGAATGSATAAGIGGATPYTYAWSGGGTAATKSSLAAGSYTCTVTDANGCSAAPVATITQPGALTVSVSATTNVSCNGGTNGTATVAAGGGAAPYTYAWTGGGAAATKTGMSAGTTYTCTVTDANSCVKTQTVTVTHPSALTSTVTATSNVSCNGGSNGSATVTAGGGTTPYNYAWSGGGTSATKTGMSAGTTYTCTITDANSCVKTQTVTVTQPSALTASITGVTNVTCNGGSNGSATMSAGGGATPYGYVWAPGGGTSATRSTLSAGITYSCTATDANGCAITRTVTVTQPSAITPGIASQTNATCGANNGAATVSVTGGATPYNYSWTGGGTAATKTGMAAGSYTCTITDASGCTASQVVTIIQITSLTASLSSSSNVTCNGGANGAATVSATGGTTPYTYAWTGGGSAATKTGMTAGTYTCTVSDASGCSATQVVTITAPAALVPSIASVTNVNCHGGANGRAIATATGGTSPYNYAWGGGGISAITSGLSAGSYTCTVTDASGCTAATSVTITQPATPLSASVYSATNVSCHGGSNGSAIVSAGGGTAPYLFLWSSGSYTPIQTGLSAGSYTCTITDANDCSTTQPVAISEPSALTTSVSAQANATCGAANGSATVSAAGGTTPYNYSWTSGAGTSATATGLSAGVYSCTVTDASVCSAVQALTITTTAAPDAITGTASVCAGGGTTALSGTPAGGTWSSASGATATVNASGVVTGVATGNVNITYTLPTGCYAVINVTVNALPSAGTISGTASVAAGGTTALSNAVSGGVWSSSNTSVATVNTSGVVNGLSAGAATISYTVTTSGCSATATLAVTVTGAGGTDCTGWGVVGTAGFSSGSTSSNEMAVSSSGTPFVVFRDYTVSGELSAMKYNGSAWVPVGASGFIGSSGGGFGMTVDPSGNPWVASQDPAASNKITVKKFNGTSWVTVGSAGISAGIALSPSIVVNASGVAYVAYRDFANSNKLSVARFDGTSWSTIGTAISTSNALVPNVKLNSAGVLYVAYQDVGASSGITVKKYSGGSWSAVGADGFSLGYSSNAFLAIDGSDVPYVTYITSGRTEVRKFNSGTNAWDMVGGSTDIAASSSSVSRIFINSSNVPYVGYLAGSYMSVKKYESGSWSLVGAANFATGQDYAMGMDASGTPWVSYSEFGPSFKATVQKYGAITMAPVTGAATVCPGATLTLANATGGGSWSSSNTGVATVGSTGIVTGVAVGTAHISYALSATCYQTAVITVNAGPAISISGTLDMCRGAMNTLTASETGGIWSAGNSNVTIGSSTGMVTGVSIGTTVISYVLACSSATAVVTVSGPTVSAGAGVAICSGASATLTATGSGTSYSWAPSTGLSDTTGASISASPVATVTYTVTATGGDGCTNVATQTVTVNASPSVAAITGNTSLSTAVKTQLADVTAGGVWSTASSAIATVVSGQVTGVSVGTTTISYTVTSGGCSTSATAAVNVMAPSAGLDFDGSTDYISFSQNLSTVTNFTYEAWVYPTANNAWARILDFGNSAGANIFFTSSEGGSGRPRFVINIGAGEQVVTAPSALVLNTWTHLAVTLDGSTARLYVNGALAASQAGFTYTPASLGNTVNNWIGKSQYSDPYYKGRIDEVRFWNVTRTQAQIQDNMNCDVPQQSGLLAYYRFNNGTPSGTNTTAVPDYSGNNRCGSLNTFTLSGATSNYVAGAVGNCAAISTSTVTVTVSGAASVCAGSNTTFTTSGTSGTWSSSNTSVATVNASGLVTGVAAGIATISYTVASGCTTASGTAVITVNALPVAIGGTLKACIGSTATITNGGGGGTWSSANAAIASVGCLTGIVTGNEAGTVNMTYTLPTGCYRAAVFTVNALPGSIDGTLIMPLSGTTTLTATPSGGSWTSSNSSVASVAVPSGVVTGMGSGTANITYTLSTGCYTTATVTVSLAGISGPENVCAGTPVTYTHPVSGGTWSSSNTSVLSIDASSGAATGLTGGDVVITYTAVGGFTQTLAVNVQDAAPAISGAVSLCTGSVATLTATPAGGSWSSSNGSVVSVGLSSGEATGIGAGVANITYTVGACQAIHPVSVNTIAAITGEDFVCLGSSLTMANATTGGVWTSSNTAKATIAGGSGILTPVSAGTVTITYATSSSCYTTKDVVVTTTPEGIAGPATVCVGSSIALDHSVASGTWSSSNTGGATVSSTGVVTGVSMGTYYITYKLSEGCFVTKAISVNAQPAAITGTAAFCQGASTTLANTGAGVWSSGNTDVATVPPTPGVVAGVSAGTADITFTLSATGCSVVRTVTVNALPAAIMGSGTICVGSTASYTNVAEGGVWSSSTVGVVGVGTTPGDFVGNAAGTATISYGVSGCFVTRVVSVMALPAVISGTGSVCIGSNITLSSTSAGLTWSSEDAGIATVATGTTTTGIVTGVSAGTVRISYTNASGCARTAVVTVTAGPAEITGSDAICIGGTATFTSGTTGGTWSSSSTAVASITSGGVLTGVSIGAATITYRTSATCFTTKAVSVTTAPADAIDGPGGVCIGSTIELSHPTGGGTWVSSQPSRATVSATGVVTGLVGGTLTITYHTGAGCFRTKTVTVNGLPNPIGGGSTTSICVNGNYTYTNLTAGGTWISSNGTVATIGSSTGIVLGITPGTTMLSYKLASTGCFTTRLLTVTPIPEPISGTNPGCVGTQTTFSTTPTGGSWSSGNTSVASVGNTTGLVWAVAAGTANITYKLPTGCYRVRVVTANAIPGTISGTASTCVGGTTSLVATNASLTWISSNGTVASVAPTSAIAGQVTGLAAGTSSISYVNAAGCARVVVVTVNSAPAAISGPDVVCIGGTIPLSSATPGGTWSSSTSNATVAASGVVTGVSAGTPNITYRTSATCFITKAVTVTAQPATAITGTLSVCVGLTTTLSHGTPSGTWTSGNTSRATVGATTGVVTGITAGTATITYFTSGGCYKTAVVTVLAPSMPISGTASVCEGATTTLSSATSGGTWSSSDPSKATVALGSGVVTGVAAGTAFIVYTVSGSGCAATQMVTVNALPSAIASSGPICVNATDVYSSAPAGGTWSSSAGIIATVIGSTGVVTGVAAGTANITYMLANGCRKAKTVTVNPLPGNITGTMIVNELSSITLGNVTTGGTWASSDPAVATIDATTGVATGVLTGNATITYQLTATGCYKTRVLTVNPFGSRAASAADGMVAGIRIFPSPTSRMLTVETPASGIFTVFTLDGRKIESYEISTPATAVSLPYNLASGVYMCRFDGSDGNTLTVRIVFTP